MAQPVETSGGLRSDPGDQAFMWIPIGDHAMTFLESLYRVACGRAQYAVSAPRVEAECGQVLL